jgi:tetratricopeptide (TPR) repeat protein
MPLMLYISGVSDIKKFRTPVIVFSIAALVFLYIRHLVIGDTTGASNELMNDSFLGATSDVKYATIFYTLWRYISLLFYPSPLTFDYYPYHISLVEWSNTGALAGLFIYIAMVIVMIVYVKKNFFITLSLLFYLLPLLLVSNLIFPIGTFMSERFMYFSSIGFCLLVAFGLCYLVTLGKKWKYGVFATITLVCLLFSIKVISRNRAWQNDYTLFTTDVKTSINGAKSNCSAGGILLESMDTIANPLRQLNTLNQSMIYLKKAVSIHPKYLDAWLLLGNAYFKQKNGTDSAIWCYATILNINPDHKLAFTNAQALVNREKTPDVKIKILEIMDRYKPNDYDVNYQLGTLYGKGKNDLDNAIHYLVKATTINPGGKEAYMDLGVAYGFKREYGKSVEVLQKALEIDPTDQKAYINLGISYQNLGNQAKAKECFAKAQTMNKKQ